MKKILLLTILLTSGISNAYQHHGYFDNFWYDFDRQFQTLDKSIINLRQQSQYIQYLDKKTNNYVIKIKITGLNKEDIKIQQKDDALTISGNRKDKNYSNSFYNAFSLPDDADTSDIKAEFENNILTISINKLSKPKIKTKTIKIK